MLWDASQAYANGNFAASESIERALSGGGSVSSVPVPSSSSLAGNQRSTTSTGTPGSLPSSPTGRSCCGAIPWVANVVLCLLALVFLASIDVNHVTPPVYTRQSCDL